jgi:hypothetical protein
MGVLAAAKMSLTDCEIWERVHVSVGMGLGRTRLWYFRSNAVAFY